MTADKRTVSTDALETLGTIIGPNEKRDAIHLAVLPIVAGEMMCPGEDVVVVDGKAFGVDSDEGRPMSAAIGVVDPFLTMNAREGQHFWLVIYPRVITSLRHVWTHPAIPDEFGAARHVSGKAVADNDDCDEAIRDAKLWITSHAADLGFTYDRLMALAHQYADSDYWFVEHGSEHLRDTFDAEKFWPRFELVTGRKVVSHQSFFSCSC